MVSHEVRIEKSALSREERYGALGHKGGTVWFTGLSGSGKSTLAGELERVLVTRGFQAYRLDGDNIRQGLNADLDGFSADARRENVRRVGEVAALFADCGVIAIVSLISPFATSRQAVRQRHEEQSLAFLEIFVDASLEVCEARDVKGLYAKARSGAIQSFTGIDSPYEPPEHPDLALPTDRLEVKACVDACLALLTERKLL